MRKIGLLSVLFFLMSVNVYASASPCESLPESTEAETLTKAGCYNQEVERLMNKINNDEDSYVDSYQETFVTLNPDTEASYPTTEASPALAAQDPWGTGNTGGQ